MFTGIVEDQAKIRSIEERENGIYYWIDCSSVLDRIKLGSSIAHDGICLTVLEIDERGYLIQAMPETVNKTNFADKSVGSLINVETSLTLQKELGGHLMMGHVDGVGTVKSYVQGQSWVLRVEPPQELLKYITYKGSITVNGVSLTVSEQQADWFEVSLIEHTLENTNLSDLEVGDKVNLEVDTVARYLESLLKKRD